MLNEITKIIRQIKKAITIYPTTIKQIASWYIGKYNIDEYYKVWLKEQIENELSYCKELLTDEHYIILKDRIWEQNYNQHAFYNKYGDYFGKCYIEINGHLFCNPEPYESFDMDLDRVKSTCSNLDNGYYRSSLNYFKMKN
jgi:hypothetical protein